MTQNTLTITPLLCSNTLYIPSGMLHERHARFSLEECGSSFLFGITTVIRQLTSSPPAETHGDHVSHNDNTVLSVCPPSLQQTHWQAVSFKPEQTSSAAIEQNSTNTDWSPFRCDRKFV